MSGNSVVRDRIWPNFELIKLLCMSSLSASMKRIRSKIAEKSCNTVFPIISPWGFFSDGPAYSAVGGRIAPNFQLLRALMHVIVTRQVRKRSDEKQPRKSGKTVFPIVTLWQISVTMVTRVFIRSGPKPNAAFPPSH